MIINVKKLRESAKLPVYATSGSAAADLCADPPSVVEIKPGERKIVPTGISIELPKSHAALICARSGLASKKGLALANGVGVIDSDYRGEIGVPMINLGSESVFIEKGDRIAQMMITPVVQVNFSEKDRLSDTSRGEGGFGSTGN